METRFQKAYREFEAVKADKPSIDTHWNDPKWDSWIKRYNAAFDELWYAESALVRREVQAPIEHR